jgi:hypothetical protein
MPPPLPPLRVLERLFSFAGALPSPPPPTSSWLKYAAADVLEEKGEGEQHTPHSSLGKQLQEQQQQQQQKELQQQQPTGARRLCLCPCCCGGRGRLSTICERDAFAQFPSPSLYFPFLCFEFKREDNRFDGWSLNAVEGLGVVSAKFWGRRAKKELGSLWEKKN